MKIDVADVLCGRRSRLDFGWTAGVPDTPQEAAMIPDTVVIPDGGIHITGRVQSTGGYMTLSCLVDVSYTVSCDRCLDDMEATFQFKFERVVSSSASPKARAREITEDETAWDGATDDLIYVQDGILDITAEVLEAIALEMPSVHLCREGCPGLCPICGKKRSGEHPECSPKAEIDPRLAILKKLLDNPD